MTLLGDVRLRGNSMSGTGAKSLGKCLKSQCTLTRLESASLSLSYTHTHIHTHSHTHTHTPTLTFSLFLSHFSLARSHTHTHTHTHMHTKLTISLCSISSCLIGYDEMKLICDALISNATLEELESLLPFSFFLFFSFQKPF